jgi:hypothetical protein
VTSLAVRLDGIAAAPDVLCVRHGLDVVRVHTRPVAALVIENKPVRDRPHEVLVSEAMRRDSLPIGAA